LPTTLSAEFLESGFPEAREQRHRHRGRCRRGRATRHASGFFVGAKAIRLDGGFTVPTPRGEIDVLGPAAFVHRFGVTPPDVASGARLAALRFAVADPGLLEGVPEQAGIARLFARNAMVIGAEDAMGAVLVFEPAARAPR
jgi:hypothetical protein